MVKVAVITGVASGIGLELARVCVTDGMKVVLSDLDASRLEQARIALQVADGAAVPVLSDVRDSQAMAALQKAAREAFGRVDYLFLNAGAVVPRPFLRMTEDDWDWLLDIDLRGVIRGVRAFLPMLQEQGFGHINITASAHGLFGDAYVSGYCVAKFGAVALAESLARELRAERSPVSVSVLCPGSTVTNLIPHSLDLWRRELGARTQPLDAAEEARAQGIHDDLQGGRYKMSAQDVAEFTLRSIREGRFWILPHLGTHLSDILQPRFEAMVRDGSLPPLAWLP